MNTLRVRAIIRRHSYVLWRSPHRWFDIAVWPLIDVILWGSLGAFVASENDATTAGVPYLLAGLLMFHVIYQTQISAATGFMEETWSSNLLNLMTTPLREVEYAAGIALFGVAKLVLGVGAAALSALIFFGFDLTSVGWGLVPIVAVLAVSGWALAMVVIGLILRYGQSAEIFAWGLNFLILAVSGVFNPIEALPGGLQPLGRALPTTYAFRATRRILDGEPLPWGDIGLAFAGSLVAAALGLAFLTHMLGVFRRRGYVTRYS
jgi:ABC-2 type transport system permease protein